MSQLEETAVPAGGARCPSWRRPLSQLEETAVPAGGDRCPSWRSPVSQLEETGVPAGGRSGRQSESSLAQPLVLLRPELGGGPCFTQPADSNVNLIQKLPA